jgi:hypothetical protein
MQGFSACTSQRAMVRVSSACGATGRASSSWAQVGKRTLPRYGSIAISRGMLMYTGPLGSLIASCSRRLIMRPGLSWYSMRWSALVYWRRISLWSRGSCSHCTGALARQAVWMAAP